MKPREPGRRRTFAAIVSQNRAGDPFYSSPRWRALRRAVLQRDNWLCTTCSTADHPTAANEVDHTLPRDTHPQLELDVDNLKSLCKGCHSRKTIGEQRAKWGGG